MNAHPFHITSFCMSSVDFPSNVIPESYIVLGHYLPRLDFRDSLEPDKVVQAFRSGASADHDNSNNKKSPTTPNILLINNDGVLVKGKSMEQVFDRLEVLDATANIVLECMQIGKLNLMTPEQMQEIDEKWFGMTPSTTTSTQSNKKRKATE